MTENATPVSHPGRVDPLLILSGIVACVLGLALLGGRSPDQTGVPPLFPSFFGEAGNWLREQLVRTLGWTIYLLTSFSALLWIAIYCRRSWTQWSIRLAGCLILLASSSWGLARYADPSLAGPPPGPGGSLGAMLNLALQSRFESLGIDLLLGACVLLGLLLAMDRIVFGVVRLLWLIARFFFEAIRALLRRSKPESSFTESLPEEEIHSPLQNDSIPITASVDKKSSTAVITHSRPESKKEPKVTKRAGFALPSLKLLEDSEPQVIEKHDEKLRDMANLLEKTFKDFGLNIKVVGIHTGPVITQYEISLETGLRVTRVTALADDLALNLKVSSVRIVAPIPGKNTVGIEVPNEHRAIVRLKELALLSSAKIAKSKLPLLLGKDSEGRALVYDLADMPHLLIAGRTGTGKSVCLNSIILSLLLTRAPEECKLLMIDPKQVELAEYGKLPHLMHPVVTDNSKAEAILSWAVDKMEERYEILRRTRVRNIAGYNDLSHEEIHRRVKPIDEEEKQKAPAKMPYIVIVIDEVGDLMMAMKKEVEGHIIRLAQKSRAAGIHLILTTQRPTVDVITGLIKSNLPARICFQVADRSNSRVVLDEMGAEKLLGKGDMLFLQPDTSTIVRAQGTFASDQEITRIVSHLEVDDPNYDAELLNLQQKEVDPAELMENLRKRDELYEQAIEIVIREGRGSVSLLQRALGIGYGRAARLIDFMAEDKIVGTYNGAQARDVLFTTEQWAKFRNGDEVNPGGEGLAESA